MGPFCARCGVAEALHPLPLCLGYVPPAPAGEPVRVRVYPVDDGDGSGPSLRVDLFLRSNGEAGSGGALRRMREEDLRAIIEAAVAVGWDLP